VEAEVARLGGMAPIGLLLTAVGSGEATGGFGWVSTSHPTFFQGHS